jgi:hypothetical protein
VDIFRNIPEFRDSHWEFRDSNWEFRDSHGKFWDNPGKSVCSKARKWQWKILQRYYRGNRDSLPGIVRVCLWLTDYSISINPLDLST